MSLDTVFRDAVTREVRRFPGIHLVGASCIDVTTLAPAPPPHQLTHFVDTSVKRLRLTRYSLSRTFAVFENHMISTEFAVETGRQIVGRLSYVRRSARLTECALYLERIDVALNDDEVNVDVVYHALHFTPLDGLPSDTQPEGLMFTVRDVWRPVPPPPRPTDNDVDMLPLENLHL